MPTLPSSIEVAPATPDRADRATFSARSTAMFDWIKNKFVGQANTLAANVYANAVEAFGSAQAAATSAGSSANSATTAVAYAITTGAVVPSTSDFSAKEWAKGTFVPAGSAMRWATQMGTTVDGTDYSAKEWAKGTFVPAGSAMRWATQMGTTVDGTDYSAKYYALAALNAPGTSALSTTSTAIATGSITLAITAGKAFAVGQFVVIANTAAPANYMMGQITAHNSALGALTVDVSTVGGSGTFSAWTVSLSAQSSVSIKTYAYSSRATLRGLSAIAGDSAIVDGLGLFVFYAGSTEPDDDESCFATTTGRWLLECPHWDLVDAWQLPDDAARDEQLEDFDARWPGRVLLGTAAGAITSVASLAQASFSGTVVGAVTGARVLATPPAALDARIAFFALVTAVNTVTVYLNNPSSSAATLIAGTWQLSVFKD